MLRQCALAIGLAVGLSACASNPQPAATAPQPAAAPAAATATTSAAATVPAPPPAPAPAPAPPAPAALPVAVDLSGDWTFSVDVGGESIGGTMSFTRSGGSYTGTVSPDGMASFALRSSQITGNRVQMTFDAPDGEAVFDGEISADRRSLTGLVVYNGQTMAFSATKR